MRGIAALEGGGRGCRDTLYDSDTIEEQAVGVEVAHRVIGLLD